MAHQSQHCSHKSKGRFQRHIRDRHPAPPASPCQILPKQTVGFIHAWLSQIQTSSGDSLQEDQPRGSTGGHGKLSWRPHHLPIASIEPNRQEVEYQSSDLFVRDSPSLASSSDKDDCRETVDDDETPCGRKRHRVPSGPDSVASLSEDPVFERRPRHKTRKDRYETKRTRETRDEVVMNKPSRSKKPQKSRKQKLRSGREVMDNFESAAVSNQRITEMKPNLTAGLFLNGRSSTPRKLADLAFNDMSLPDQNEMIDGKNPRSNNQRKRDKDLQAEFDFFADALARTKQKPPLLGSSNSPEERTCSRTTNERSEPFHLFNVNDANEEIPENLAAPILKGVGKRIQAAKSNESSSCVGRSSSRLSRASPCDSFQGSETDTPDLAPRKGASQSSPVPGTLVDTGVFAYTGVYRNHISQSHLHQPQQEPGSKIPTECGEAGASNDRVVKPANYEDKVVTVSPRSNLYQKNPSIDVRTYHGCDKANLQKKPNSPSGGFQTETFRVQEQERETYMPPEFPYNATHMSSQGCTPAYQLDNTVTNAPSDRYHSSTQCLHFPQTFQLQKTNTVFKGGIEDGHGGALRPHHTYESHGAYDFSTFLGKRSAEAVPHCHSMLQSLPQQWTIGDSRAGNYCLPPTQSQQAYQSMVMGQTPEASRQNLSESTHNGPEETLQEYIERIEHEVLGRMEAPSMVDTGDKYLDEGSILFNDTPMDSHISDPAHDTSSLGHLQDSTSRALALADLNRGLTQTGTFRPSAEQQLQLGGRAQDVEESEMTSFWRPNYLMQH